jgi:hypothetical protein
MSLQTNSKLRREIDKSLMLPIRVKLHYLLENSEEALTSSIMEVLLKMLVVLQ